MIEEKVAVEGEWMRMGDSILEDLLYRDTELSVCVCLCSVCVCVLYMKKE